MKWLWDKPYKMAQEEQVSVQNDLT